MSDNSGIEWTDATWNPMAGCDPVSAGCLNCYAAGMAIRLDAMGQEKYKGTAERRGGRAVFTGRINFGMDLDAPINWKKPRRIFVNSMSDLFHKEVSREFVKEVCGVMKYADWHTYIVLTKRPERIPELMPDEFFPNLQLYTSTENQETAEERIPHLMAGRRYCPILGVSAEPLLGPIDFRYINLSTGRDIYLGDWLKGLRRIPGGVTSGPALDHVIVGGESGPHSRPCDLRALRDVVKQCQSADVPIFVKQMGAKLRMTFDEWNDLTEGGSIGSPHFVHESPGSEYGLWRPNDKKGGNLEEWPEDVRLRQLPRRVAA